MMKILLVAIGCGVVFISTDVAGAKTDREKQGLIGKVRSIRTKTIQFKQQFGQWIEQPSLEMIQEYNAMGNQTEVALYDAHGSLTHKNVSTYDVKGHVTEVAMYQADGSLQTKIVFTYDSKGNKTEAVGYKADGSPEGKTVFTHDSKGNETQSATYGPDGIIKSKRIFTYDAKGNKTQESHYYNARGALEQRIVETYDSGEKHIEQTVYKPANVLEYKTVKTYDDKGTLTGSVTHDAKGLQQKYAYTYEDFDSTGNWRKQTTSRWVTKFGKSYWEPSGASYRTITYY